MTSLERSMNGATLCTPASDGSAPGDCDTNPDMGSLLTYMTWLDEPWAAQGLRHDAAARLPANRCPHRRRRSRRPTFRAKVQDIHGVTGQGQTAQGEYAFPPLWGVHSFNAAGTGWPATRKCWRSSSAGTCPTTCPAHVDQPLGTWPRTWRASRGQVRLPSSGQGNCCDDTEMGWVCFLPDGSGFYRCRRRST